MAGVDEDLHVQDTGDTRETPAIDVCKGLLADNAKINIYDPKVTEAQIHNDLSLGKFMWDHPTTGGTASPRQNAVFVFKDAYEVTFPSPVQPPILYAVCVCHHACMPRSDVTTKCAVSVRCVS